MNFELLSPESNQRLEFACKFHKENPIRISDHISIKEVACPMTGICHIHPFVVRVFEEARKLLNKPIRITSGYRHPRYQKKLSKVNPRATKSLSPHSTGSAIDMVPPKEMSTEDLADLFEHTCIDLNFPDPRIGISNSFIHFDMVFMLYYPYTLLQMPGTKSGIWVPGKRWGY